MPILATQMIQLWSMYPVFDARHTELKKYKFKMAWSYIWIVVNKTPSIHGALGSLLLKGVHINAETVKNTTLFFSPGLSFYK